MSPSKTSPATPTPLEELNYEQAFAELEALVAKLESEEQSLEEIETDTNRDYYLTAEEAVEYGLVDHVLEVPEK